MGSYFVEGQLVAEFNNFSFHTFGDNYAQMQTTGPFALAVVLIAVTAISLYTIFLFNKRKTQMRLTVFNLILLVGYLAAYAFFAWLYQQKMIDAVQQSQPDFQLRLSAVYPLVSIILCVLGYKGIRKDEKLIQSLNRIR
jgi:hypothetical protein